MIRWPRRASPVLRSASIVAIFILALIAGAADRPLSPYKSVKPILDGLGGELPPELQNADETRWNAWSRREDQAIRARLEQGDIDSMVNLLLFGTSFTSQPRIQVQEMVDASKSGVLRARLLDLLQGLRAPAGNERLVFLRNLIRSQGLEVDTAEGFQKTGVFVLASLERVLNELRTFAQRIEDAKRPGDAAAEFAERSRVFRDRGVSLDTSILPNFGIEQALRDLNSRGMLRAGKIERVAVVGPGLDFTDWDVGYDYYPQQTLQPFALYDSLERLGLGKSGATAITVFDISSRVLDHLRRARERARSGGPYVVQLPRDPARPWLPEAVRYWRAFGDRVGEATGAIQPPAMLGGLETRAVRIRPQVVLACQPVDLDIVFERFPLKDIFDLVIATNIFVYYDTTEQALALQNVAAMLKPGGFLLSNSELRALPSLSMRKLGYTNVQYAAGPGAGDRVNWYQKQ